MAAAIWEAAIERTVIDRDLGLTGSDRSPPPRHHSGSPQWWSAPWSGSKDVRKGEERPRQRDEPDEHAERNMTGATLKTQTAEALNVSEEST